jgi:hypothetical protein
MPKRYTLKNGESSFDGLHPASVKYCGTLECGYHNNKGYEGCVMCGKFTHYSLHRRYKFSKNLETQEKVDRLWLCSDECAQAMVFRNTFDMVLPWDVSEQILAWKGK